MEMKIVTANRVSQTTGRQFAKWNYPEHLTGAWANNLEWDSWSGTDSVRGNSLLPNRPATLTLTDFRCNLPQGARVKKISVRSSYNKAFYWSNGHTCEPGQPTISFVGTDLGSQKGAWTGLNVQLISTDFNCDLDASVVNSSDFGIVFDFPTNRNNIRGYVIIRKLFLEIYYELPDYTLTLNKVKGEYKKDDFEISASINNKTDTSHVPLVQITIPQGFVLEEYSTKGNITKPDSNTLIWNPKLNRISSDDLFLRFSTSIDFGNSDRYTGTFNIIENYNSSSKNLNVTVFKYHDTSTEVVENQDKAIQNEDFTWIWRFTETEMGLILEESEEGYVQFNYIDLNGDVQEVSVPVDEWQSNNEYECTMIGSTLGTSTIKCGYANDPTVSLRILKRADVDVVPNDTDARDVGVLLLPLSEEELNRLGEGIVYTAQTMLNTTSWNEAKVRDWKYNFRLGIFNESIPDNVTVYEYINENGEIEEIVVDTTDYENLTINEIIDNAIWSEAPSIPNGFNNLTCNFRYNPDYPLYVILTGDCIHASTVRSPRFTEPVISETAYYHGEEPNGVFPAPILNTLANDDSSEMIIPSFSSANSLIFYDFDFNLSTEKQLVRGAMISGNVNGEDIAISSKLINQGNETRVKSLILQEEDTFTLGGYGDNWGFKTGDIKNLNDWEVNLTPSNTVNTDLFLNMSNIQLSVFVDKIESSVVKTYIEGEDLDYYGIFLTDLKIPEGLETDTDYIHVNGTDYNEPSMQTIKEKEIELEFDLSVACDIYGNTAALRQFTKLLVNDRNKYNKPVPKRIEFSHYPEVFFEYILEKGFTPELDINTYKVKLKLTIPAGTSFTKNDVITTNQGYVDGLTHVHPTILLKPFSSLITIRDLESKQVFNIGYSNYNNSSMRIDCKNKKVYLINDSTGDEKDISRYVDINADWFRLLGYFNLQASGCIIQNVRFKERW